MNTAGEKVLALNSIPENRFIKGHIDRIYRIPTEQVDDSVFARRLQALNENDVSDDSIKSVFPSELISMAVGLSRDQVIQRWGIARDSDIADAIGEAFIEVVRKQIIAGIYDRGEPMLRTEEVLGLKFNKGKEKDAGYVSWYDTNIGGLNNDTFQTLISRIFEPGVSDTLPKIIEEEVSTPDISIDVVNSIIDKVPMDLSNDAQKQKLGVELAMRIANLTWFISNFGRAYVEGNTRYSKPNFRDFNGMVMNYGTTSDSKSEAVNELVKDLSIYVKHWQNNLKK